MTKQDQQRAERILAYVRQSISQRGYPPSVREIAQAVGLASTSAVHHHLTRLEKDGKLTKQATRSRALSLPGIGGRPLIQVPVFGEVSAGGGVYAYEDKSESIGLPSELTASSGHETYVLKVRGDSMIEDHIQSGDYVVVQSQTQARDGDIVVALLDDGTATLKRYFRERDRIRLQPSNSAMEPIYAREVKIQGKCIGVIRRLT